MKYRKLNIGGVNITDISYNGMLNFIKENIENTEHLKTITYVTFHTINLSKSIEYLRNQINSFDIVHPDGIGIFFASRILYGKKGLENRITGSDFYPLLYEMANQMEWRIFFLAIQNRL